MFRKYLITCAFLAAATTFAHADATIPYDPSAPQGNFGSPAADPGATANAGYTIALSDSNGYLTVLVNGTGSAGVAGAFANLYFDTAGSSSNLGFEFGQGTGDAFTPGVSGTHALTSGFSENFVQTADGYDGTIVIPNAFFETDPDGMGFTKDSNGSFVSLHLSQTYSYSVVGGSTYFPAPDELGAVTLSDAAAVTPEPSSFALLGTGVIAAVGMMRRRFKL